MESNYLMDKFTRDNGMTNQKQRKDMVYKFGQMDPNMKDFGIMIWHVVTEDSFWLMEMFIKEIGLMIKHMATENIFMLKVQLTKADGTKINKKVTVEKNGQMVHFMRVFT